jgi:rhodanese-related sulfurtransferase
VTINRALAATAFVLAAGALAVGRPSRTPAGHIDVDRLASMIAREEDHVTAVELGGWLRDGKAGLRVIDVRAKADFDEYHIPRAENVPLPSIGTAGFRTSDTLVLYSDGGAHAAQAWVMLRSLGLTNVYFLRGGLGEWLDDVMTPMLPDDATPAEREAFRKIADLSTYFGGKPGTGPRPPASATSEKAKAMRRGGC